MTTLAHCRVRSFPNGDGLALARGLRVKLNSGSVALAAAAEDELGIVESECLAGDEMCSVRFLSESESVYMVADGAVTLGADVYRDAAGKVTATQAGSEARIGVALAAASGDGSEFEVLPKRLQALS